MTNFRTKLHIVTVMIAMLYWINPVSAQETNTPVDFSADPSEQ